jgi:glycosyltransferase involved in cell wall biosynthesis
MKVLGIITSEVDPASRIRISQYKKWFELNGEKIDDIFFSPLKEQEPSEFAKTVSKISRINKWTIWNAYKKFVRLPLLYRQYQYDLLWQSRLLIPENFHIEKFYRKPFVFDFDDAIWINEGEPYVNRAFKKADKIFAGNSYLAEYAFKHNSSVVIIPTTVDTEIFFPKNIAQEKFTIGWIGTNSNFPYLETIRNTLLEFIRNTHNARLMIVSSEPPSFFSFDNDKIVFKKWAQEKENDLVNEFSIGIMPLPDNNWTRGKCGYKILQYMACNKPFIASPTGINKAFIENSKSGLAAEDEDNWLSKLTELKNDLDLHTSLSLNGRSFVETHYSARVWSKTIIEQMKQII